MGAGVYCVGVGGVSECGEWILIFTWASSDADEDCDITAAVREQAESELVQEGVFAS